MYEKVGQKLKLIAKIFAILGIITSIVYGIIFMTGGGICILLGLLIIVSGSICSWIASLIPYAIGQILINTEEQLELQQRNKPNSAKKEEIKEIIKDENQKVIEALEKQYQTKKDSEDVIEEAEEVKKPTEERKAKELDWGVGIIKCSVCGKIQAKGLGFCCGCSSKFEE